jgi:cation diffusion facilitator CzcD-associated flavoprotein CzcO
MSRLQRVLVVGDGIAGFATARALLRYGIECEVVEWSCVSPAWRRADPTYEPNARSSTEPW